MLSLSAAAVFVIVTHFASNTPLRPAFVDRFGERAWLGAYSLVSFVAWGWLGWAYHTAEVVPMAPRPLWGPKMMAALMPLAFILIAGANVAPNPSYVGMIRALDRDEPAQGLLRVTRHPLMWGISLLCAGHMVTLPDQATWVAFGSQVIVALVGARLQERRKAAANPEGWARYEAATSFVPFVAILQGRNRLPLDGVLAKAVVGGLVTYFVTGLLHPFLFGPAVFPIRMAW